MNAEFNSLGRLLNNVALVTTQYVESYSENPDRPYFKFKGGSHYIVHTDKDATAIGVVLQELAQRGLSNGEYPRGVQFFASVEDALNSVDEWEREYVKLVGKTVS